MPSAAKDFARSLVTPTEFTCLNALWTKESHWRTTAKNPRSTAYGIGQELGETSQDARTQILDGLAYIRSRYQTACRALAHSTVTGWY